MRSPGEVGKHEQAASPAGHLGRRRGEAVEVAADQVAQPVGERTGGGHAGGHG